MGKENETMRERLKSKKGFTLAELLIVVAIIAVLVAIMIPVFGSSRESAILSKDAANIRAAYAEAVVNAMSDGKNYDSSGHLTVKFDVELETGTNTDFSNDKKSIVVSRGKLSEVKIPIDDDISLTFNGKERPALS